MILILDSNSTMMLCSVCFKIQDQITFILNILLTFLFRDQPPLVNSHHLGSTNLARHPDLSPLAPNLAPLAPNLAPLAPNLARGGIVLAGLENHDLAPSLGATPMQQRQMLAPLAPNLAPAVGVLGATDQPSNIPVHRRNGGPECLTKIK